MAKNYIDVFPEIFDEFKETVDEKIEKYKSKGLPKGYMHYYMNLEDSFKVIGIGECILNKDVLESKKNFYLSASMRKVIFEKSDLEDYMDGDYAYRFCEEIDAIYLALLSENKDLINSLIDISGQMNTDDDINTIDKIFVTNELYAIKYIILKQFDKARVCVEKIKEISNERYMKPYLDYEKIFTSILNKDEKELNKALKHLAQNNKKLKEYKGAPEELFCLAALGLAKLAMLNGMKVELDEPSAPKEILEKSDIIYPKVDFVD